MYIKCKKMNDIFHESHTQRILAGMRPSRVSKLNGVSIAELSIYIHTHTHTHGGLIHRHGPSHHLQNAYLMRNLIRTMKTMIAISTAMMAY